ncbi:MAG: hypothetical protein ACK2UO_06570 [Caldilineaceae bacterium]|jgi:predicted lipoprotein with Yx(FWY)xxD motif
MPKGRISLVSLLLSLAAVFVMAACQPVMPEAAPAEDQMSETPVDSDTSDSAAMSDMAPTQLMVGENDELGAFLVDGAGMTLYMFMRDEPGVSNCYDACAERWPALLANGDVTLADGLDASMLGTTERTDGTMQVTYNGWPLYYWYEDAAPGDTLGQTVGDVWFVLSPAGEVVGYVPPDLTVANTDELGDFLADSKGLTLYVFLRDEPGVSNCYDDCEVRWPPLVVDGEPKLADGVDEAMVGTTQRTDGSMQVTYNGWPLYYWYEDAEPGQTLGQAVGDVWFVIAPSGEVVQ